MTTVHTVCESCGAATEADEDFCGSCGAYLEWEERPADVEEPVLVDTAAEELPPDKSPGLAERVKSAVGLGPDRDEDKDEGRHEDETPEDRGAGTAEDASSQERPADGETDKSKADGDGSPEPVRTDPDGQLPAPRTGAGALVVGLQQPGSAGPTTPRKPEVRRPARPRPVARRKPTKPLEPLQPGDLVCGDCGAGNRPTRKFCRRCGHDLAEAEVARISWWRRIFRRGPKRGPVAGTRPKQPRRYRRVWGRRFVVLAVLAALVGGGWYGLRDRVGPAYERVQDRIQGDEHVNPTTWKASSAARGHGAKLARDGFTNRYWAPARPPDGKGQSLSATFAEPFRLVSIVITPGVSAKDEEAFLQNGRPHEVNVVLIHTDGSRTVEQIELEDKIGRARFGIHESDVESAKLTIRSSYPGTKKGTRTAIAEVEFRGR